MASPGFLPLPAQRVAHRCASLPPLPRVMGICLPFLEWGHCNVEGCRSEHLQPDHPGVLDLLANRWLAHADEGFCMTAGSSFEQTAVDLDDCDECPSPQVCVYPTVEQADQLVALLRSFPAVRKVVSIGAGEGFLEGQLERRGIAITAVDLDVLPDPARYRSMRRYCSSIVRVRPDALLEMAEAESTALLFVWGAKLPWEAYLARYPNVPLVVIVGDPEVGDTCATNPSAVALEGKAGWKQVLCTPVRAVRRNSMLAVYTRCIPEPVAAVAAADAAADAADADADTAAATRNAESPPKRARDQGNADADML